MMITVSAICESGDGNGKCLSGVMVSANVSNLSVHRLGKGGINTANIIKYKCHTLPQFAGRQHVSSSMTK